MWRLDLNYHKDISDDLTLFTKFYYVHQDADTYFEAYPEGFTGANDMGLIGEPMWKSNSIGGELSANYTIGDHLVTSGLVYEENRQYDVRSVNNFADPFSSPMDTSQPSPYPFVNATDESTVDGIEAELKCRFGKNRCGYLNVSYQNSEDDQGRDLPYVADWMGNAGYNHEFFGKLNTNVNVYWIGERTRLEGDTRDKAPSATLVDTTLILRNFYKRLEIKGSVFNIFDEDYVAPSTITSITNDLPLHERMFFIEVLYHF
jgi:outer membrane receptor protein involved in Fe transport